MNKVVFLGGFAFAAAGFGFLVYVKYIKGGLRRRILRE
jgi:hypothetical protein